MAIAYPLRLLFAALLFASAVLPGHALQLGETKEQIIARHGAPGAEDRGKGVAIYFWSGWSAELEFNGDVVQKLIYRRDAYLQASEIASLLQSNGGMSRWRETTAADESMRQWMRDDGGVANCLAVRPLMITFQAGKRSAIVSWGGARGDAPNVLVPAAPPVASSTPPSFPKLPGSEPEPSPTTTAELRPLPKLPAEEVAPALESRDGEPASEPQPLQPRAAVAAPQALDGEQNAAAAVPPPAEESAASGLGMIIGLVIGLGAVVGGAVYFFRIRRGGEIVEEVKPRAVTARRESTRPAPVTTPALDALRNDQFELLVGEIFRREGYTVELSAAAAEGDSIDLTLRRDSETILVQCKHWKASRVTEREVREFYGAMMANGSPRGIFVTAGSFSRDAQEFAEGKQIDLMDRAALEESTAAVARPGENFCEIKEWVGEFTANARVFDPECPICQGTMVIRHNRANGAASWCCRNHPRCPGRREPRLDLLAAA